jgi:aerobic-type carbon monoxide dehydrogenase small subunit (CoxS/CutS family)
VELLYGTRGRREKKREQQSISNIVKHNICEGRGYKDVLNAVEKCGVRGKGVRESNERD